MNGCKCSCLTLVALAGASAAIAGGILAASSATAEPTSIAMGQAVVAAASTTVAATAAPAQVLPLQQSANARVQTNGDLYTGTKADVISEMRAAMLAESTLANPGPLAPSQPRAGVLAIGPDPCDSCDPDDVTNTASAGYDPSILAVYQEDDVLAAPDGSGLATCAGLAVDGPFWMGANDHCRHVPAVAGESELNVDTQLPLINTFGVRYQICGQVGNLDVTGFLGSPLLPGDPPDEPLAVGDYDVWEFQVAGGGQQIRVSGYASSAQIQVNIAFNLDTALELGTFDRFRSCNDRYGRFTVWPTTGFVINTACTEDGQWSEFLGNGYYYVTAWPTTSLAAGTTAAQLCEYWYNVVVESIDPEGACCIGVNCTDDVLKSACWTLGGVFRGNNSSCASAVCCDTLATLAGELLTADYTEGDLIANPDSELRCNIPGSQEINAGCQRDNEGDAIPGVPDIGEPVVDSNSVPIDYCADPDKFVIVGYAGTPDDHEASFIASQFFAFADSDLFVFENTSGASQLIEMDAQAAGQALIGLQVWAGGAPDGGIFAFNCDVTGFLAAIFPACQRASFSSCMPEGTWAATVEIRNNDGITCDTPYWIALDCGPCPPVACCLPNGTCVEVADENVCNYFLEPENSAGGIQSFDWSSCCYVTCPDVCDGANIPSGSVVDDDCTTVDPFVGDLVNSGCDAPDGSPVGKFSNVGFPTNQSWCGSTGFFVDQTSSRPDLNGDDDYYFLDFTSSSNDVGVRITIEASTAMLFYMVRDRSQNDCPQAGVDGTDDPRTLGSTTSVGIGAGTNIINFCLEGNTTHFFIIQGNGIVECGIPYSVDVEFYTDGCFAACCNTATGCQLVADLGNTVANEQATACNTLRGTFRGANTRCPGSPVYTDRIVDCCTVAQQVGDIIDLDHPACPTVNNNDLNRGCITGSTGNLGFQNLSASFAPGVGPVAGTSVTVYGSVCRGTGFGGVTDSDFYSFSVPAGDNVEYLVSMEASARINVFGFNAADLGVSCNINATGREVIFNTTTPCNGGSTVAVSGLAAAGDFCMIANQDNYLLVQPQDSNDGNEARYRMTVTAYECRLGACCFDASLCTDQLGYLECEAVNGGQFIEGASCPDNAAGLNLCRGVCCVDDAPNAPICVPNTTAYDCCVTLNAGSFTGDSGFAGYTAGDLINDIDCTNNPDICEEGACCIDSVAGYTCQDNLSATQCSGLGGVFQGIGSGCASVSCPSGACCVGPACVEPSSPLACANAGGTYQGDGSDCGTVVCEQVGACCFSCAGGSPTPPCPDPSGPTQGCVILSAAQCAAANGLYVGNNSTCTQGIGGPCDCIGDVNNDGNTTALDFNILAGNFGGGNPNCLSHSQGDLNCDGVVTALDFNLLAGNFGCTRN